ncbi:histidine kinase [Isoptericola hypogeus]|uniref:histidine kinase n=1 Tax=Isoptericola hypogeus TaxID=300179 RepID=A0ABP4VF46_9MICO
MVGQTRVAGGTRHGLRRAVAPLVSAATVRAGVYLVIGGLVAGAYFTLAAGFVQMFTTPGTPRAVVVVLAVVTAAIVGTPPFLAPVRALEVAAVRTFLDVDARDLPDPAGAPTVATRWRGAAWFALHLALGAAVTLGLLVAVPLATQLVLSAVGVDRSFLVQVVPAITRHPAVWLALAVVLLVALPYLTTAARRLLRQAAVPLLGPDQSARIAELEAQARRADERGRLARELHDSVGHALTITTLQAAAAARLLDADPSAARRSLAAIEETGRGAMADLDHVLGALRGADTQGSEERGREARGPEVRGPEAQRAPARTLADLPALADDARRAGADVRLAVDGPAGTDDVPRAVAHEAYRVVQEAVTNAVRHAPGRPVSVRVALDPSTLRPFDPSTLRQAQDGAGSGRRRPRTAQAQDGAGSGRPGRVLQVEVRNPLAPDVARRDGGGRGLPGMAERVRLLGGELSAGPGDGTWVVRARFPA